jgi:predicted enzyme related to lactoylglutathione lyase
MSDFNSEHNRAVWFDIPVADLDRAAAFYGAVLAVKVHKEKFDGGAFCVLDHRDGNGGCLVHEPSAITSSGGILVYMNVDGRIATRSRRSSAGERSCSLSRNRSARLPRRRARQRGNRIALHPTRGVSPPQLGPRCARRSAVPRAAGAAARWCTGQSPYCTSGVRYGRSCAVYLGASRAAACRTLMDLREPHVLQHGYVRAAMAILYRPRRVGPADRAGRRLMVRFINHYFRPAPRRGRGSTGDGRGRADFGTTDGARTRIFVADGRSISSAGASATM